MGNSISQRQPNASGGKVILWDGSVHEFDKPLTVAELMLEHPQQVVVEFQPAVAGKRPTPLPADKKLETRRVYLMVPMKPGGKAAILSPDDIRRVLLVANTAMRSCNSAKFLPLFARICPAVSVAAPPKKEYCRETTTKTTSFEEEEEEKRFISLESFRLEFEESTRPEYLSRQLSGRGWKPSLDTIEEKNKVEKRVSHWLF